MDGPYSPKSWPGRDIGGIPIDVQESPVVAKPTMIHRGAGIVVYVPPGQVFEFILQLKSAANLWTFLEALNDA
jgi:hypothetical protein